MNVMWVEDNGEEESAHQCGKSQCGPRYICKKGPKNSIHLFHLKKMKKKDLINIQFKHEVIR